MMILSDPSFEESHGGEYYALYFETGISRDYANNCDYRPILTVFFHYFSKVFLQSFMVGLQSYNIYRNLAKIVLNIKFHISVPLTFITFLLVSLLSS